MLTHFLMSNRSVMTGMNSSWSRGTSLSITAQFYFGFGQQNPKMRWVFRFLFVGGALLAWSSLSLTDRCHSSSPAGAWPGPRAQALALLDPLSGDLPQTYGFNTICTLTAPRRMTSVQSCPIFEIHSYLLYISRTKSPLKAAPPAIFPAPPTATLLSSCSGQKLWDQS